MRQPRPASARNIRRVTQRGRGKARFSANLNKEVAAPSMGSVRNAWGHGSVVAGLTPQRLAGIMRAAEQGDIDAYLTLAEEMEEREPHYGSVLATRKRAVAALDPVVISAGNSDLDDRIADAVRKDITECPEFEDLVSGLQDALGKGFACVEMMWKRSVTANARPLKYEWRDPRWFTFDREDARTLLLKTNENPIGEPLELRKWCVYKPKLKMGIPIRAGLARLAAWSFLFKNYTVKDWVSFVETYGMPLRIGKYGKQATEQDKDTLLRAVMGIGTDAAAVIPESMKIEFEQAMSGSASSDIFMALADWTDRQVSKAVLGQTMATDEGGRGGRAQAEVHDGLRDEIRQADAKAVARCVSGSVIKDYVDLNFGPQEEYPQCAYPADDGVDRSEFVEDVTKLVDRGLPVKQSEIYTVMGLTKPDAGDAVLGPQTSRTETETTTLTSPAINRALNRQDTIARPSEAAIQGLQSELENDWQEIIQPITSPVERLAADSNSAEEFLAGLNSLTDEMDGETFARELATAMTKARAEGDEAD